MGNDSVYSKGLAYEALPTAADDDEWRGARQTRYNERFSQPIGHWRAQRVREGTYFIAHNPTNDASTTLAGHAAPVLADADATMTKPFIHLVMPSNATVEAELDFIEIEVVTAGATATQACWAAQLDTGTTRITTAGTTLTKVNPNMRSSTSGVLVATGGAIVVGVESADVRHLGHGTLRPSIEVAGDIKMFTFGDDPAIVGTQAGQAATAIRTSVVCLPSVILGPSDAFLLALHGQASQNAAGVYKVRLGWSER